MRVLPLLALLLSLLSLVHSTSYPISSTRLGRVFDGIGGLSGGGATSRLLPDYSEPYKSQILDYLFKPHFGASLQILKVEIGGDIQSTEGTEASHMHSKDDENYERGYEWWLMKEAKARNPAIKLYGLPWGFPGWVTEGGSSPYTNSTVDYITKWVVGAKEHHGLTLDFIGSWNEHPTDKAYIVNLRKSLDAANFSSTRIIVADDCCGRSWAVCDTVNADAGWASNVYAVGAHYPNTEIDEPCRETLEHHPLWASEDFSSFYQAGGCWTRLLNRNALSNITATIAWNLIAAYYSELPYGGDGMMNAPEPWSGWYDVGQVIWSTAHTTQFTDIGWRYLEHGSGVGRLSGGGTYVGLTDGHGSLTVVVEAMPPSISGCVHEPAPNETISAQEVTLVLGDGFEAVTALHVFRSSFDPSAIVYFEHVGQLPVVNGSFTWTVSPGELYTLSTRNGTKGSYAQPPARAPFPLPYHDDFNSYNISAPPKYLTDQTGSFEVVASANATHDRVLRQMTPQRTVAWCGDADLTFTLLGDHSWSALHAEVSVLIEETGTAFIAAAVRDGGCVGEGSDAIVFAVSTTGAWQVSNNTSLRRLVTQGKTVVNAGVWYRLGVEVTATGTTVMLDGKTVATVAELTSGNHRGWVALGSSYDHVQFDDLEIRNVTMIAAPVELREAETLVAMTE